MTHLEAIRAQLAGAAAVTALVGARIRPQKAEQGDADAGPFIVITQVSAVPQHTFEGLPSELLEEARMQVDCYSKVYRTAHQLFDAVDDVLGALSGSTLSAIRENASDSYDDEAGLHRVSADYMVLRGRS